MKQLIEIIITERIYPYVRMTQRSKFVDTAAKNYMHNQKLLKYFMIQTMNIGKLKMFENVPLACDLSFQLTQVHKADLDNLIKAVLDAGTGIVYANDAWIDSINARRKLADYPKLIMQIWEI